MQAHRRRRLKDSPYGQKDATLMPAISTALKMEIPAKVPAHWAKWTSI